MIKRAKILFLGMMCILAAACQKQAQPPPLELQEFADVYAQAVLLSQGVDSLQAKARVDSMLQARGIQARDLEQTVAAYQKDVEKWGLFLSLVEKKLEDATSVQIRPGAATPDSSRKFPLP